ncbi:NACHT and WD40 repeat domain-containing protein [Streptomyces roseolilacinus]|uniref:NACHT domain-containing protein n=1 Tax=Streptomyces roseolilacinus TaxID=66904 RepID=A0A918AWV3_9ACTN|nr:WD40 repeat domain-containing protein [Streptomyces roseolilacinus]GGP95883.1 hypothetical protein GCM10010249_12460 [Streptomyces roseolilacinus]
MLQRTPRHSRLRAARVLAFGALALAGLVFAVCMTIPDSDGARDAVAAIAGLFVGLAALVPPLLEYFRTAETPLDPAALADDLALRLREQWLDEARARRLRDPRVLPLAWTTTERDIADTLRTGPAGSRVLRLRLDGRSDGPFDDVIARLAEGYGRVPHRRLVVVGEPGSGKTVLALLLTLGLLAAREQGAPVPVLLPVSSWDPVRERLDDWIVRAMAQPYYNGRTDIPRTLLSHGLLIPVLDGLDEIPESARRSAVRALNQATGGDRPLVVTCRAVEYEELIRGGAPTLRQAAVVEVLPVTPADAVTYLQDADRPPGVDWGPVRAHLRAQPDSPLAGALSTPLMVTAARLVYRRGGDPAELLDTDRFDSRYAVEDHLLHGLVDAAYAPDPTAPEGTPRQAPWTPEQARGYLAFLARHLHEHRERDLEWWRLSGRLLSPRAGVWPGFGLGGLLVGGVMVWSLFSGDPGPDGHAEAFALAMIVGIVFALLNSVVWYASRSRPPGRLAWSVRQSRRRLYDGFRTGASLSALVLLPFSATLFGMNVLEDPVNSRTLSGVEGFAELAGVVVALIVVAGLGFAVHKWLDAPPAHAAQVSPALLLAQDRRSSIVSAGAAGAVVALVGLPAWFAGWFGGDLLLRLLTNWAGRPARFDLTTLLTDSWDEVSGGVADWRDPVGFGLLLPGAAFTLLLLMSRAWPRFVVARVWLAANGRLPWRLMDFLADARRRGILRQAGGAYQFRHIRLQEALAGEAAPPAAETTGAPAGVRRRTLLTAGIAVAAAGTTGALARRYWDSSVAQFTDPAGRAVRAVRFRPGTDPQIALALEEGPVLLWDDWARAVTRFSGGGRNSGLREVWGELLGSHDLEFSADGGVLYVPDGQGVSALRLSDLAVGSTLVPDRPRAMADDVYEAHLAIAPGNRYMAALYGYEEVAVWELGEVSAQPRDDGRPHRLPGTWLDVPVEEPTGLAFLGDGTLLVLGPGGAWRSGAAGFDRGEKALPGTRYVLTSDDQFFATEYGDFGNSLLVSRFDGRIAVVGPGGTELWRTPGGGGEGRKSPPQHLPAMRAGAFHPTAPLLAVSPYRSDDTTGEGDVHLYRYGRDAWSSPRRLTTLRGHAAPVLCLDFSLDGGHLVTGDEEGTVRVWDVREWSRDGL